MKPCLLIVLISFTALPLMAAEDVAKAIILKGEVFGIDDATKKEVQVTKDQWIKEGTVLKTKDKSFIKLLFVDKSQINLGPNSEMKIAEFPKNQAGIINLVSGELRSKVTKDYMDIKDKDKSKLFIQTKTAAMGIRGTDFQITYNDTNKLTSLVTFEGKVAMGKLDGGEKLISRDFLEKTVSSERAVMVTQGQYSGVASSHDRVSLPVKISPLQLASLVKNENFESNKDSESSTSSTENKQTRSVLPPGVSSKEFMGSGNVEEAVATTMGTEAVKAATIEIAKEAAAPKPPVEGFYDPKSGAFAPPAGGFVDIKTGLYIAPDPRKATFDANTGVYVVDRSSGGVDPKTGEYVPPTINGQKTELTPDGKIIPVQMERAPASIPAAGQPPQGQPALTTPQASKEGVKPTAAAPMAPPPQIIVFGSSTTNKEIANMGFIPPPPMENGARAPGSLPQTAPKISDPCEANPALCAGAKSIENTAPVIKVNDFSRVKFIFNTQD